MKCVKARKHLIGLVIRTLSASKARAVVRHLAICPSCTDELLVCLAIDQQLKNWVASFEALPERIPLEIRRRYYAKLIPTLRPMTEPSRRSGMSACVLLN